MKKYFNIIKSVELFNGIDEAEYQSLLSCLSAKVMKYDKNQAVFSRGEDVMYVGIILSGQVQVMREDYYGNRSILAKLDAGMLFGETFVCADIKKLPVSVFTTAESEILFIDYHKLTTTCNEACSFHNKLIQNMLRILALKNIMMNQKIEIISKRTTREKLLAYLSLEALRTGNNQFNIPYNRQELADYLSVDRSAMSSELCKLRDSGMIRFYKNQFEILK